MAKRKARSRRLQDERFFMFKRTKPGVACLLGSSPSLSFIRQMGESAADLGYDFFVYGGTVDDQDRWKVGSCYKLDNDLLPTDDLAGRRR